MEAKSELVNHIGDDESLVLYLFRLWRLSSVASARFAPPALIICEVDDNRIFIIAFVYDVACYQGDGGFPLVLTSCMLI